jgi:hypothetical protein
VSECDSVPKEVDQSERRKAQPVLQVNQSSEELLPCKKFSSWRKLIRVTGYVLRFIHQGKKQTSNERKHPTDRLPITRLEPLTPPFHRTACNYFGPYHVKIGRSKTTKHYGVLFTCLNTQAVHLELQSTTPQWNFYKRYADSSQYEGNQP